METGDVKEVKGNKAVVEELWMVVVGYSQNFGSGVSQRKAESRSGINLLVTEG